MYRRSDFTSITRPLWHNKCHIMVDRREKGGIFLCFSFFCKPFSFVLEFENWTEAVLWRPRRANGFASRLVRNMWRRKEAKQTQTASLASSSLAFWRLRSENLQDTNAFQEYMDSLCVNIWVWMSLCFYLSYNYTNSFFPNNSMTALWLKAALFPQSDSKQTKKKKKNWRCFSEDKFTASEREKNHF